MGENGNKQGGLSPKACILMAIGGMVGSAIFTLSGVTYGMAGASAIFTWIIAGGVLLLYSLNVSELATTFPESGGVYVYPHEVIGKTERMKDFAGWAAAWSWLNSTVFGTAFAAICVSTYLKEFVPAVKNSVAMQRIIPLVWIDLIIPVVITVYNDRSFSFVTKTPPAAVLIKKACNIKSGSGVPNKNKVATITKAQLEEIAKTKMPDLNAATVEAAVSMIAGTCRSMGVSIEE